MGSAVNPDPVRRLNNRGRHKSRCHLLQQKKKNTHILNHSLPVYINEYDGLAHNGVKASTGSVYKGNISVQ